MQESNIKEAVPQGLKSPIGEACKEKYWEELSIEEKIERNRNILKGVMIELGNENNRLRERITNLEVQFQEHAHSGDKLMFGARAVYVKDKLQCDSVRRRDERFF